MGQDTYSDGDDWEPSGREQPADYYRSQPEAYWRRRVIALCAGLALLGLLAWAFSGGGKAPAKAQKAGATSSALPAAAYSGPATSSSGASGSAPASSASVGSAATLPFPAVTPSPGHGQPSGPASGQASGGAASQQSPARTGTGGNAVPGGGTGVEPDGTCAPGSVVLSLFASRTAYYRGQYPSFQVDAVSTASRTCSFDLSPGRLHVQVTSKSRVIWDSADCGHGQPNRSSRLRRGVPAEASVTWRRIISLPGCVTVASSARPGSYQVQAKDAGVTSPVRSFRLAR